MSSPAPTDEHTAPERAAHRRRRPSWSETTAVAIMVATLAALGGFLLGRVTADGGGPAAGSATSDLGVPRSSLGSPDAPVTMVEYSDFQCPYCRRYATETLPTLVQEYVDSGQLRLEWHDFPAQGPVSVALAVAGRAAEQQGMFWDFHEAAFGNAERITDATQIRALAEQAGLDLEAFDAAIQDPLLELAVRRDYDEGQARGVTGTPAFLVNGRAIRGAQPLEVFRQLIESELTGQPIPTKRTADPVHLAPADAAALLADPPDRLQVVDVRTAEEIAAGTVVDRAGLIELDFYGDTFGNDLLAALDPDAPVFVYCRSGNRSGQTVAFLADQGFAEVYDLDGGIVAWQEAGLPLS